MDENLEDGVVKIIFIKSAENDSDILTKNVSDVLHEKQSKKMIGEKLADVSSFENI